MSYRSHVPERHFLPAILVLASLIFVAAGSARERKEETDSRGVLLAIAQAPAKARDKKSV